MSLGGRLAERRAARSGQRRGAADPTRRRRPGWLPDALATGALLVLFPVVHNVGHLLAVPYWLDEAWVAMSVRFPLTDLPVTTALTPIGWSLLLRVVPGPDQLRLLPLAFDLLAIVAAYVLARSLGWPTRLQATMAGVACALGALLLPAQQVRHDLKQYTADAFVAVALLVLVAWVEAGWSDRAAVRRRLGVLAGGVALGMTLSYPTAIVAAGAFGGLLLVAVVRRAWWQAGHVLVAAVLAGLAAGAVYTTFVSRRDSAGLHAYWAAAFPTVNRLPAYLGAQLTTLAPYLGMVWPLFLAFFVAGLVTMLRLRRPATAAAAGLVPLVLVALGLAGVFPLLDLRTSHFLLVVMACVGGLGAVGVAVTLAGLLARVVGRPREPAVAIGIGIVLFGGLALANLGWYRSTSGTPMDEEDVRTATRYVAAHRTGDDVIVMNEGARYGFAYYWTGGPVDLVVPYPNTVGWSVGFPGQPRILVVPDDPAAVAPALDRAASLAGGGSRGRVWVVHSHVFGATEAAWQAALDRYAARLVTGGPEPLAVIGFAP